MQRKGDQSHHDDHRCEDRDDVTVTPSAKASSGPFVAHGWFLVPLNRAHPCLGRSVAPPPGLGHAVVYAARAASPRSAGAWCWELRIARLVHGRQLLGFL
jgi:hypothetical protein